MNGRVPMFLKCRERVRAARVDRFLNNALAPLAIAVAVPNLHCATRAIDELGEDHLGEFAHLAQWCHRAALWLGLEAAKESIAPLCDRGGCIIYAMECARSEKEARGETMIGRGAKQ